MGVITEAHHGVDGATRVFDIEVVKGKEFDQRETFQRPQQEFLVMRNCPSPSVERYD